jgi:hypothetical protein
MNRDAVLYHLQEAKKELDRTIIEIEKNQAYETGNFLPAMSNLYHHLNTAWNGKDTPVKDYPASSRHKFHEWRKFPPNDDLLLF